MVNTGPLTPAAAQRVAASAQRAEPTKPHGTGGGDSGMATAIAQAGQESSAPTLVMPLDQAEELFSADASSQVLQVLTRLRRSDHRSSFLRRSTNHGHGGEGQLRQG